MQRQISWVLVLKANFRENNKTSGCERCGQYSLSLKGNNNVERSFSIYISSTLVSYFLWQSFMINFREIWNIRGKCVKDEKQTFCKVVKNYDDWHYLPYTIVTINVYLFDNISALTEVETDSEWILLKELTLQLDGKGLPWCTVTFV